MKQKTKIFSILLIAGFFLATNLISQSGQAKLMVYTTCKTHGQVKIFVDGQFKGTLTGSFSSMPNYGQQGTVSIMVSTGSHEILAQTADNNKWTLSINVAANGYAEGLACN
jgi:hypothetical protein